MTNTQITKGQRVIVRSLIGEESATVESIEGRQYGPAATRVTLAMDDRSRYSCPLADVRPL